MREKFSNPNAHIHPRSVSPIVGKIKVFPFKRQSKNVIVVIYKYLRSSFDVQLLALFQVSSFWRLPTPASADLQRVDAR